MRHASVFSGIGGPEVAAEMLGWENIFHCEINPFGRQVLEYWFPNSDSYEDITKTDFTQYRGQIDILTGGFPCQPFSYAGKRGGREDERYLWPEMLRVINEVRPTWVVCENVAGITTMVESCEITELGGETSLFQAGNDVQEYRAEFTFTIEQICKDLEDLGYSAQPMLIPAAAVGAPHRRDRVFIIAYASDAQMLFSNGCQARLRGNGVREEMSQPGSSCGSSLTNPYRNGGPEAHQQIQPYKSDGAEPFSDGGIRIASDTACEQGYRCTIIHQSGGTEKIKFRGGDSQDFERIRPENRWKEFPTVSPVHRGNDGLPFDVDNLTISFSKWKTESLKAYGNAIVPQVMYRIFQAIEDSYKPQ